MQRFIVDSYNMVMDARKNPLRHLDLASQHYVMQVLAWMWSMVFSLAFLSVFYFHYVWGAHVLIAGGICFTVGVFRRAEKKELQVQQAVRRDSGRDFRRDCRRDYSHASACTWKLDREA